MTPQERKRIADNPAKVRQADAEHNDRMQRIADRAGLTLDQLRSMHVVDKDRIIAMYGGGV
jgi:hypothetical protein